MTTTLANPKADSSGKDKVQQQKAVEDRDSLDLVRNILFGEQAQKAEERRRELERLLDTSINALQAETEKRFESLSQELSALISLLADETKARQAENNHTQTRFNHLNQRLSQFEIKTQKIQSQLHEKLIDETSKTHQEIRRVNEEITLKLERAIQQLQYEKADRKALAGLLSGIAKQLLDSEKAK